MLRATGLSLMLVGLFPAAAVAAALNDGDADYLGVLSQKGTQMLFDIAKSEGAGNGSVSSHTDGAPNYCLERLRSDIGLITLEGDHLQSILAIARKMVDPSDEKTVRRFATMVAETVSRRVQPLRNDVTSIAEVCPADALTARTVTQALSLMDEFASVAASIAGRANMDEK